MLDLGVVANAGVGGGASFNMFAFE